MKKMMAIAAGMAVLFASCVSLKDRTMTPQEREQAEIVGSVTAEFTSFQLFHFPLKNSIRNTAYSKLMKAAQAKYGNNVEIRNISVSGGFSLWEALYLAGSIGITAIGNAMLGGDVIDLVEFGWPYVVGFNVIGNFQKITATGDVVLLSGDAGASRTNRKSTAGGVEGALERAAEQTLKNVPKRARIAIVFITAQDRSTTDYIAGELEFIWVNAGYIITDRSQLDRLRREQNFQMSGEVDDATAVSIGKFAGADIIVTGRVDGEGNLRRLRLRALDTQTAQVVGVASERL